jgi:hypothetical protein
MTKKPALFAKYRVFVNIAIMMGTLLLMLFVAEHALRIMYPGKYVYYLNHKDRPIIHDFNRRYGRALAPNFNDTLYNYRIYAPGSPLVPWRVLTNNFGWREPYFDIDKPQGTKRLMLLGNSVAYGQAVDYEKTMSRYLNHALRLDPVNGWEVLNRSAPGWTGWHELEYFKSDGRLWKPDVVVTNTTMSHFKPITDDEYPKHMARKRPLFHGLLKKSYLLNMCRIALGTPPKKKAERKDYHKKKQAIPPADYGLWGKDKFWYTRGVYDTFEKQSFYKMAQDVSFPRYLDLKAECDKIGAYMLVVILPTASQTSKKYWTYRSESEELLNVRAVNEFATFLAAHDIPFVNLTEAFRIQTTHSIFMDEAHLTPTGHQVTAREIMKHLGEQNVVQVYDTPFWD